MKYFKKLVGERIYLSPLNVEDAEKYTEWFCDFVMTDGVGGSCKLISLEGERDWIQESIKKNEYNFAIVDLETDQLIGNCGINRMNNVHRIATVGIFIGEEKNRNNGYGTEALKLLLDFGFNYLNLNNIMLGVKSFNDRAIACYKKVGFKEIGRRRQSYYLNGKYYDDIYMDYLAEEFHENYIKNKNV